MPEPGRGEMSGFHGDIQAMLRDAGRTLMSTAEWAGGRMNGQGTLFDNCNIVSSLFHEGREVRGQMVIAHPEHPSLRYAIQFQSAVPLRDPSWARKILQMASTDLCLLCDSTNIYGLGYLSDDYDPGREDLFIINFLRHYTWDLRHDCDILMRTEYGVPGLPRLRLREASFKVDFCQTFSNATEADADNVWKLVNVAAEQRHGTMVVVSERAGEEALRLKQQATLIKPTQLSDGTIRRISSIDGAILVDPGGTCYAVGVILDGKASDAGTPSRGARFNSAVRYVNSALEQCPTMAVVISEDGHLDVLPPLMPRVRRSEIAEALRSFHRVANSPHSNYHIPLNWLHKHQFYLTEEQCRQLNDDLMKLSKLISEVPMMLPLSWQEFKPNPDLDESYFLPEDA